MLTGAREFSPPAPQARGLRDDEEIKDDLLVWVIGTNKTFGFAVSHATPLPVEETVGRLLAAEKPPLPMLALQLKIPRGLFTIQSIFRKKTALGHTASESEPYFANTLSQWHDGDNESFPSGWPT